jgi:signal transduction histidine kinase
LGSANNSIGINYYRNDDFINAEKYFESGLNFRLKTEDFGAIADSYYKLAMVFDDTGRPDKAKEYFQQAISYLGSEPDCVAEADVYNGLAALYYKLQMPDSTEYFALKAMDKYFDCGNLELVSFMYMNLASLVNMQKNHQQALEYLNAGLEIADSLGLLSQLRQGYRNLSETYAYMGDYENAYINHLTYITYKDSIFNIEKAASFQELNILYETEKKEREIIEKQSEIELKNVQISKSNQQRNLLIIIAVLFVIAFIFGYYRFAEKKKYAKILDKKNAELESINAAKDKLFSIISHDLSSPISSYTRLTDALLKAIDNLSAEQLKEYISELNVSSVRLQSLLSNLLQWSVNQSGHFVPNPVKTDITQLMTKTIDTIKIVADEKQINFQISSENNIPDISIDEKMISTVFRNILSNAIKFSPENSTVEVNISQKNNSIQIIFDDAGPGMDANDLSKLFKYGEDISKIGRQKEKKGTGLGLILAYEFVVRNGGQISAGINENGGLRIIIDFDKDKK